MKLRCSLFRPKAINFSRCQTAWIVVGSLAIFSASPASAATYTWDGGSTANSNLQTAANWAGDVAPTAVAGSGTYHDIVLAGSTRVTANNDFGNGSVFNSLAFASNAAAFTLSGNTFWVNGNVTNSSSNTQTISAGMGFGLGDHSITTTANMLISGVIRGAGGIVKEGTGKLTLSGNNSYSGNTTINAGNLAISHSNALGDTTGNTTIAGNDNGSYLSLSGALSVAEAFNLSGRQGDNIDSAHIVNTSGNNTLSGAITASMGGNMYNIQSDSGTLTVSGNFTTSSTVPTSDRYLQLSGVGNGIWSGLISNGSNATVNLNKRGAGTWTLSGANTYSGTTTIQEGTLSIATINNSGADGVLGNTTNAVVLGGSSTAGTLRYTGASATSDKNFDIATGGGAIQVDNSATTLTLNGQSTGLNAINVTKTGAGNLTLGGSDDNSGFGVIASAGTLVLAKTSNQYVHSVFSLLVDGGTVKLDGTGGDQIWDGGSVTVNSGTFDFNGMNEGFDRLAGSGGTILNNGASASTMTIWSGGDNYSGIIADGTNTMALVMGGANTQTLSGNNTYTGSTTVSNGTLAYGISNALASGSVTVDGGTLDIGTFSDTVGAVTLSSGTITGTTGVLTGSSYALQGGTVTGNLGAGTTTVTTGTTTLIGTSGSLALNVNSGTLALGASDRLANTAAVTVAGGILNTGTALTDTVGSFNMSSGSLTGTGTITAASYGLSGGTVTGNLGAGTTTVTTGTTTLNGTSGSLALNVNSGTLALGASDRLANTAAVTVAGGIFDTGTALTDTVGSFSMSSGSLTGTGTITAASYGLSGGTVTGNLGAGTTTVTTGTTTLNGTSGSLALNINSGTLALGASNRLANTAAVTVAGGILSTGTFSDTVGAVTLSSGSITGTTGVLTGSSYAMSGTGAVSAILGGTGVNFTKTGAGTTTTLSAANTYTGTTTVSQGTLTIGNGSNAGSVAGSIVVNSGASLNFSRTGSLNIANVITGAGSVDFKGGATYNITAANTYSGGTNLNAGSSLNISDGGSLSGNISNLGSLSYSYTSGERTLATPMTGSGDVSYGGGATYNLTAAQTSTGATRIDSGIVKVSSTGSITGTSSVSVAAGSQFAYNSSTALVSTGGLTLAGTTLAPAVLGGSGVIGSALLVDSLGDTLAPGNSPGTLGFSTSQAWNSFTYNWQVQNFADGIAGIDYDQIAITGGLNLTGSSGSYVLDMESWTLPGGSGGASVRGVVGNLVDTKTSMTILTTTAGITGFDMANWTINRANFDTGAATLTGEYLLSVEGNNMVLTYVPEPDVALLGGIGFIILFRRRRS